jgi:Calx-beta domain/Bacterial Ig-like domain
MASNLLLDSAIESAGTAGMVGGQFVAQLGELGPGASAQISLVVTPETAGTITQTASVTAQQVQLNPANATTTTTVTVLESPGTLQFSNSTSSVANTAGMAYFSVVRILGSLGAVTVNYQSVAVDATPGLDFVPTSGTLTFAPGQTVGTIAIPVLNDPWENHNDTVNLVLSSPGGGATLGTVTTAQLSIIDTDPDRTAPEVSQLSWSGSTKAITSLSLTFTEPLNSVYASDPANFELTVAKAGQPSIPISMASYNPSTYTVTLVPSAPLASNRLYQIEAVGTGASSIRDLAGNLLDGAANGLPGSSYVASFGQGTKLKYVDQAGNTVSLKLSGGGYMQDVLYQGEGQTLIIVGEKPHRSVLSGTLKKTKRSSGNTNLGIIRGLGNFGDVQVTMKSPPFLVKQYPFMQNGRGRL